MAEAFGIVTGVVALLPICAKGCAFIGSIVKAHRHAEEQLIRIQMQQWVGVAPSYIYQNAHFIL